MLVKATIFAGNVVQRLDRDVAVEFGFVRPLAVFVGELLIDGIKAWNVVVDEATGITAPDGAIGLRRVEVPRPHERAVLRQLAVFAADFGVRHEGKAVAKVVKAEDAQRIRFAGDEDSRAFGQCFSDSDLIVGEVGQRVATLAAGARTGRVLAVDLADAERVVEAVEEAIKGSWRSVVTQSETLVLGDVERGEQSLVQLAEAAADKVVARGWGGGKPDADLAVGVFEAPGIEFGTAAGDGVACCFGVRGDDKEFASGVDNLGRRRQFQRFKHLERGAFGEQRDLEGAAAQQLVRVPLRCAAVGENEVLDAEEVALDKQDLFFVPAVTHSIADFLPTFVVPAPERCGECGGRLAVVVERDFGLDAERRCRRDGVGGGEPQAVEVVEPERQVGDV